MGLKRIVLSVASATTTLFLAVPISALAATTVGNNVSIGGTLTVAGATTLSGTATLSSSLTVTGLTTMVGGFISNASSSVGAGLQVSGNLSVSSTMTVNTISSFLVPSTSDTYGLGTDGVAWSNAYVSNTIYVGGNINAARYISIDEDSITGLSTGNMEIVNTSGGLSLGTNSITGDLIAGPASGIFRPNTNNYYSLGKYGYAWINAYVSSTVFSASSTIANTATSTAYIYSTTANRGGQIVLKAYDGNCYAVYMGNSGGQMEVTSTLLASCY